MIKYSLNFILYINLLGGKCGVCGDSFSGPRLHETGGKFATGIIVKEYKKGEIIDVFVMVNYFLRLLHSFIFQYLNLFFNIKFKITSNHLGFIQFKLCPVTNPDEEVTQECLDENVLQIIGYGNTYQVRDNERGIKVQ